MNQNHPPIILIFLLFLVISIACSTVTGIPERIGDTRNTAEAVATQVHEGVNLLGTARAIATEVGGNGLIETAQALATEAGDSQFLQTAQAFATQQGPALLQTVEGIATEQGPELIETARAFATQEAPGYVETAQALATEQGPELIETAQALATQVATNLGEAPADIPLVEGERSQFYAIENLVFYLTPTPFPDVLAFYQEQMPANGWEKTDQDSLEGENAAVLIYQKDHRNASIALSIDPINQHTIVLITIIGQ